jgi:hypothetical protein
VNLASAMRKKYYDRDCHYGTPAPKQEFSKPFVVHGDGNDSKYEYPDHGSLLLNKRNISNLLIIRNAGMKHVLGERCADVAKASRGAAHFLAIGRDHPLRGRDAAGEQECQNDVFVHSDTPLLRSRYSKAASRNLST